MAEYKDIVYAENTDAVSYLDEAYRQVVSVGDALEGVKYLTPIVCADAAAVAVAFPSPKQFDRVYRTDTGAEYSYFEAYNKVSNPLGRAVPGWYAISSAMLPIYDSTATHNGTFEGSSDSYLGKLTFHEATTVQFPNCFSSNFDFYRIVFNITDTSTATSFSVQLVDGGVVLGGATYNYQLIQDDTAAAAIFASFNATGSNWLIDNGSRNIVSEIFMYVKSGESVRFLSKTAGGQFGASRYAAIRHLAGSYAQSGTIDGFQLSTGAVKMTGTIQVWGIKGGI